MFNLWQHMVYRKQMILLPINKSFTRSLNCLIPAIPRELVCASYGLLPPTPTSRSPNFSSDLPHVNETLWAQHRLRLNMFIWKKRQRQASGLAVETQVKLPASHTGMPVPHSSFLLTHPGREQTMAQVTRSKALAWETWTEFLTLTTTAHLRHVLALSTKIKIKKKRRRKKSHNEWMQTRTKNTGSWSQFTELHNHG